MFFLNTIAQLSEATFAKKMGRTKKIAKDVPPVELVDFQDGSQETDICEKLQETNINDPVEEAEAVAPPPSDVIWPSDDTRPQVDIRLNGLTRTRGGYNWSKVREKLGPDYVAKIKGKYHGLLYEFVLPDNDTQATVLLAQVLEHCAAVKSKSTVLRSGLKRAREEARETLDEEKRTTFKFVASTLTKSIINSRPTISVAEDLAPFVGCVVADKIAQALEESINRDVVPEVKPKTQFNGKKPIDGEKPIKNRTKKQNEKEVLFKEEEE